VLSALRRPLIVLACGLVAMTGLLVAPPATAQQTPGLNYSIRTSVPDLAHAQNGDPLRITLSGLPANATADWAICPAVLPDGLVTFAGAPNNAVPARVAAYCGQFNDELSGSAFPNGPVTRGRSATTGDITFDVSLPRGSSTPHFVVLDPTYTNVPVSATVKWPNNPDKKQFSFTCNESHPCTWLLHISAVPPGKTAAVQVYDQSVKFSPAVPGSKVQGCGGIAPSTLAASAPERFGRTLVGWNQLLCAPTGAAQSTNIVSENEDGALNSFDTGDSDIAISGSGGALAGQHVRARTYVPVGLNAAVVAAVGWSPTDRTDAGAPLTGKVADNLKFGWDDVANLLSKGGVGPDVGGRGGIFHDNSALVLRNATLAAIHRYDGSAARGPEKRAGVSVAEGYFGVTGEAGKGSVPLFLSSAIAKSAPGSWVYGKTSEFTDKDNNLVAGAGGPVGTVTDLGSLGLGSANIHNADTKTGRIAVRKQVNDVTLGGGDSCSGGCLNWVVTDLATATEYGWTPIALPDGAGGYIAPTAKSLQAAATHFQPASDGSLTPGDIGGDRNAYPLTFAESIAAPLNPLVDANCQPEKAKQDSLATLLKVATNGGQSSLARGLVPLSPELLGAAQDAAAKVGGGTSAAACQENQVADQTAAGVLPPPAGPGGSLTGPDSTGLSGQSGNAAPAVAESPVLQTKAPTTATVLDAQKLADSVRIPGFSGTGPLGTIVPLIVLVVLVVLPSATAYLAAGRPLPPWLETVLKHMVDGLAWLGQRARGLRFAPAGGGA
jgi:hypothetical protein